MPPKREHDYIRTTVEIRQDYYWVIKQRKWKVRKLLEDKIESMITPEDLAYMEKLRLEEELEKQKKVIGGAENKGEIAI